MKRKRLLIATVIIFKDYLIVTVTIFKDYLIVTVTKRISRRGEHSEQAESQRNPTYFVGSTGQAAIACVPG